MRHIICSRISSTGCVRDLILSRCHRRTLVRGAALEKGLVDAVETSDELLLGLMESHEVIGVRYQQRKKMLDRFTGSAAESADRLLLRWWQRGQKPLM